MDAKQRKLVKQELLGAAKMGIAQYLATMRGANLCGADAYLGAIIKNEFEVRCRDAKFNPTQSFSLKVKEN